MSTIHLHRDNHATPEQYIAGLTDFGPGRSKLFGNSADEYLKVHQPRPHPSRRHRGLGRHLGTPALRLVRSQPRRSQDDRLQHVGRRIRAHLQLHTSPRRSDRHRRGRCTRRQDPQGMDPGTGAPDCRQGRIEEGVCKASRRSKPETTWRDKHAHHDRRILSRSSSRLQAILRAIHQGGKMATLSAIDNESASGAGAVKVDMKFEVVVIVSCLQYLLAV